ncbi:MAG: hypothetical protein ABIJ96_16455 [Elusimicrobiota bacterium]
MGEIAPLAVADFRLRALYPNLRDLFNSFGDRRARGKKKSKALGYFPPIAEYRLRHDAPGRDRVLELRDVDVPLLMNTSHDRGKRYMSCLLEARKGNAGARAEIDNLVNEFFATLEQRYWGAPVFADRHVVPSMCEGPSSTDIVSHKGSILLKLSRQGYPVPDFVVLTSNVYLDRKKDFARHTCRALSDLERLTGQRFGSSNNPIVVAVRCAMPRYYPGLMPTYLNAGVIESTLPPLSRLFGEKAACRMYLNNLRNLLGSFISGEDFKTEAAVSSDLPLEDLKELVANFRERVARFDRRLLEDAVYQVQFLADQAYRQYDAHADLISTLSRGEKHYPSLILQKMVCTVRDDASYAGVLISRDAKSGSGRHLEIGRNIFGEDIMTGTIPTQQIRYGSAEEIKSSFPAVYHFSPALDELEREFEGPVTVEFAAEGTRGHELFAMLQLNDTGMTGQAAFISTVDMHKSGIISRKRLTQLILPYHIKQLQGDAIDESSFATLERFSQGVSILPRSAVCAQIYFSAEAALGAKKRGERVCFCKKSFTPADAVVMREVDAIVSLNSAAIHVVAICQSFGTPALLNLEAEGVRLLPAGRLVNGQGVEIEEGVWVTISSRSQALFRGKARLKPARFSRYLRREKVPLSEEEEALFSRMAYAYRYYQQLVRGLKLDQVSSLSELIRLVNLEMRGEAEEARDFVHGWFDSHEAFYVDEVLKSEMGDHLNQHTVFDMLTLDRKIRFYKLALERCAREKISGYAAGTFMLGRFLSRAKPVDFWKSFVPAEAALLVNEWVLFEKYIQVLYDVGERQVTRARHKILKEGLETMRLAAHNVAVLVTLKLSPLDLAEVRGAIPEWADPQTSEVLQILSAPYKELFDFSQEWSRRKLEGFCAEAKIPVPGPEDR